MREVVTSSREGGASLEHSFRLRRRQLQRLLAGHDDAGADGHRLLRQHAWVWAALMLAPAVFAFGLVAFGFLGMGPVTIAVDSYGPVTDNAQSVYELSTIEQIPGIEERNPEELRFRRPILRKPRNTWKRTTAPETHSRRQPSRC